MIFPPEYQIRRSGSDRDDPVGLIRQVLGDDAPQRRTPQLLAQLARAITSPDRAFHAPRERSRHREWSSGRLESPPGTAEETARGIRLVELQRMDVLAPHALPGVQQPRGAWAGRVAATAPDAAAPTMSTSTAAYRWLNFVTCQAGPPPPE